MLRSTFGQTLPVLGVSGAFAGVWLGIGLMLTLAYGLEKLTRLPVRGVALGFCAGAAIVMAGHSCAAVSLHYH